MSRPAAGRTFTISLRAFLLGLALSCVVYVALIALVLERQVRPAAAAIRVRGQQLFEHQARVQSHVAALRSAVDAVTREVRILGPTGGRLPADVAARLSAPIHALLDSSTALLGTVRFEGTTPSVRMHLVEAVGAASEMGTALVRSTSAAQIGDLDGSFAALDDAQRARARAEGQLESTAREVISDVIRREEDLGRSADTASRAVTWWIVIGLGLIAGASFMVRDRIYRPLSDLEKSVRAVTGGALETEVLVRRDDEIGRLGSLFNRMTEVLRQRADASEARYRTLFEQAGHGMAEVGVDGKVIRVNRGLAELAGAFPGNNLIDVVDEDHRAGLVTALREIEAGTRVSYRGEVRLARPDGHSAWVSLSIAPLRSADGAVTQLVVGAHDISEQRALQGQIAHAQRMDSIGRLAGGVAHDFNNLLTAILGYVDFIQTSVPKDDPIQDDLLEIERTGRRAADLTKQLLTFARRQVVAPRVVDLNELTTSATRMLDRLIGEQIHFETALSVGLWPVLIDPGQYEQVVVNLVVNARDAMPNGGRLAIATANVVVDHHNWSPMSDLAPGRFVELAVTDTGSGMTEETRARLFEPFFTTKGAGKGTGLGLAICYGIIKQAGGTIRVDTEPGHGSTFRILLPVAEGSEQPPAPTRGPRPAGGNATVLVIEDEDQLRALVARTLTRSGFRVITAANGQEAVEISSATEGKIDLAVTDLVMPLLGGPEAVAKIRRDRPELKALFMSGYADSTVPPHRLTERGDGFLPKPFDTHELMEAVAKVIGTEGNGAAKPILQG